MKKLFEMFDWWKSELFPRFIVPVMQDFSVVFTEHGAEAKIPSSHLQSHRLVKLKIIRVDVAIDRSR